MSEPAVEHELGDPMAVREGIYTVGWFGVCSCGWVGLERESGQRGRAMADAVRHLNESTRGA